jgi:hypothetical protein
VLFGRVSKGAGVKPKETVALLLKHWEAVRTGEMGEELAIYHNDVTFDFPQTGETINGITNLRSTRIHTPKKPADLLVRRILGSGNFWLSEYKLTYEDETCPEHAVSIMEFRGDKVFRETQYMADPLEPPAWRAKWIEKAD